MDNSTVRSCIGCAGVILLLLVITCSIRVCQVATSVRRHLPAIMEAMAPIQAIDNLMQDLESQGYTVVQTKDMEDDPSDPFQQLIEYRVTSSDGSSTWVYTWGFKIPPGLMFSNDLDYLLEHIDECELIPISQAARDVHDSLEHYMPET